jgi:hypothetical protein
MATNDTEDWRELFDAALFEPNRSKLRQRTKHAREAINNRFNALMKDENEDERSISEHIALRDALSTLADLYRIAYARKPSARASGGSGRATAD